MTTVRSTLFGGALIAAGLASNAGAQCGFDSSSMGFSTAIPGTDYSGSYAYFFSDFGVSDGRIFVVNSGNFSNAPDYVSVSDSFLNIYDATDPSNITLLSSSALLGGPLFSDSRLIEQTIHVVGNTLAGDANDRVRLWDITDPINPQIVNEIDLPGFQGQLWEENGLLFCETRSPNAIHVLDISSPLAPQTLDVISFPDGVLEMGRPTGSRLPVLSGAGIFVFDISDPTNLSIAGAFDTFSVFGTNLDDPVIAGNAVVVREGGTLRVIDFADPANPVRGGDVPFPGSIDRVFTSNGFILYVAADTLIEAWDLSDPANPARVAGPANSRTVQRLAADGGVLLGVDNLNLAGQLTAFNVSGCSVLPTVLNAPVSRLVPESTTPEILSVNASAALTYQWSRDGVPLADGGDFAGVTTPNLSVAPNANTEGIYTCTITNADGSDTSGPSLLGVRAGAPSLPGCAPADLVLPFGVLDLGDVDAFIGSFLSGCP
ncbi:MAG: hypothetical protein AAGI53_17480 [Planctomycetota bacterium]